MLKWFAESWAYLRDLAAVARPCRVSIIIVLAGVALLASPQGQELTVRLPSESLGKVIWFDICVFLWAFQSWYWSRVVLDMTYGLDRGARLDHPRAPRIQRLVRVVPRAIAVASYLLAVVACLLTGKAAWKITLVLFFEGVLFLVFLVWRTDLMAMVARGTRGDTTGWKHKLFMARGADPTSLRSLPLFSKMVIAATLAAEAGLTA